MGAACFRSGRYSFCRALFMRLLGSMDIKRVRLGDGFAAERPRSKQARPTTSRFPGSSLPLSYRGGLTSGTKRTGMVRC
jgi:hypothetical protein